MEKTEKAVLCTLHSINGLGNRSLWKIKEMFGSFTNCFQTDSRLLYAAALPAEMVTLIDARRKETDPLSYLEKLERRGIEVLCIDDEAYPELLRNIADPPYVLYLQGKMPLNNSFCIALVGCRNASAYGRKIAYKLSGELALHGMVVVSGMARGIDAQAHLGALDAEGRTVAVLGSGFDHIYPRENLKLFQRICANGVVMSEFPVDTRPQPGNFPVRNRLISGLCRGVVVVEAKARSGALITADFALEQGRDVFAVPGPVDSENSEGANNLIKQGAQLITGADDILQEYDLLNQATSPGVYQEQLQFLGAGEKLIMDHLNNQTLHFDEIINGTGLDIGELGTLLLKLELSGIVKSLPGNYYVKV